MSKSAPPAFPPREVGLEEVSGGSALVEIKRLFREYAAFLNVDLRFQGFEEELASLPGKYAPPAGVILLASILEPGGAREPAGCVALRGLGPGICEMKRLFVRPERRGLGIGGLLASRLVEKARVLGYCKMRLDTLDRLDKAVALYRSMGFKPIDPYYDNPLPDALFWELDLVTGDERKERV